MSKDFLKLTAQERDAEAKNLEREILFDETRPLSARSKALWEAARHRRTESKDIRVGVADEERQ